MRATGSTAVPFFFLFGDYQGSAQVVMPDVRDATTGDFDLAASAGAVLRNAYTPYGATRAVGFGPGAATEADAQFERGWLSQVADETTATLGTGLTYLNARYYDPISSRFLSPDPLLDVMDPKTLDPYRYADNNPIEFTDASGLYACNGGWSAVLAFFSGGCEGPASQQFAAYPSETNSDIVEFTDGVVQGWGETAQQVSDPEGYVDFAMQVRAAGYGNFKPLIDGTQESLEYQGDVLASGYYGLLNGNPQDVGRTNGYFGAQGYVTSMDLLAGSALPGPYAPRARVTLTPAQRAANEALLNGKTTGAAAVMEFPDGKPPITGVSGTPRNFHPELADYLSKRPKNETRLWSFGMCAEMACINEALWRDRDLVGATIDVVAIGDTPPFPGGTKPACPACRPALSYFGVKKK